MEKKKFSADQLARQAEIIEGVIDKTVWLLAEANVLDNENFNIDRNEKIKEFFIIYVVLIIQVVEFANCEADTNDQIINKGFAAIIKSLFEILVVLQKKFARLQNVEKRLLNILIALIVKDRDQNNCGACEEYLNNMLVSLNCMLANSKRQDPPEF